MSPKIYLTLVLACLICTSSFSQVKDYPAILPKDIHACPILDSVNYLPDSLKQPVINRLTSEKFDLKKCFVDKIIDVDKKEGIIDIRIWDVDELKSQKAREKHLNEPFQYSHYSGNVIYNIGTKKTQYYPDFFD